MSMPDRLRSPATNPFIGTIFRACSCRFIGCMPKRFIVFTTSVRSKWVHLNSMAVRRTNAKTNALIWESREETILQQMAKTQVQVLDFKVFVWNKGQTAPFPPKSLNFQQHFLHVFLIICHFRWFVHPRTIQYRPVFTPDIKYYRRFSHSMRSKALSFWIYQTGFRNGLKIDIFISARNGAWKFGGIFLNGVGLKNDTDTKLFDMARMWLLRLRWLDSGFVSSYLLDVIWYSVRLRLHDKYNIPEIMEQHRGKKKTSI